ncbi:hypothetical protein C5G87_14780 [Paenibacillus peoriae]|uniref:hypothetical protein n=1 Tax=Paenibacillus peoriae TaxID=59893 RepID=UPI000CEC71D2|nr:hypothetical protein [Paenibacillus peoriae]PPQ48379.1 hypothetical protein C5G87_14780 [Paenibacillus peoriae]
MGLLPLDPSRVGQMCKVGCCLVLVRAVSRVLSFVFVGIAHKYKGHALVRGRLFSGGGHVPGCLLRKGGDVSGK